MAQLQVDLRHPRVESRAGRRASGESPALLSVLGGLNLLVWAVLVLALAAGLGFDTLAAALTGVGVTSAVLSLSRPAWYWNSGVLERVRRTVGDRGVLLVSLVLCGVLSAAGIQRQVRLYGARAQCAALLAASQPGAARNSAYEHPVRLGPTDRLRKGKTLCRDILSPAP